MLDEKPIVKVKVNPLDKESYRLVREQIIDRLIDVELSSRYSCRCYKKAFYDYKTPDKLYRQLGVYLVRAKVKFEDTTNDVYVPFYTLNPDDKKYITEDILQDIKRSWAEKGRGESL